MTTIADLLAKLEALAAEQQRSLDLRPPASQAAIDALERALGEPLPAAYRELLEVADGQAGDGGFPWMPGCHRLAPCGAVTAQLVYERGMAEDFPPVEDEQAAGFVRADRFLARRVPIAGTEWWDGDTSYLDLDPGSNGRKGQLITTISECDFVVLGESLGHALERYVEALASGALVWHPEEGTLAPRGKAAHATHPAYAFALVR